ncbi:hypothetical protein DFH27DRAFT_533979 [Peziza echinospora]|nr:hypothetical protein DFH27DRAFT_533979 [Peziza echinospora]
MSEPISTTTAGTTSPESPTALPYNLPDFFSDEEWLVLFSLTSAIVAAVDASDETISSPTSEEAAVLSFSASIESTHFRQFLLAVLQRLPESSRESMKFVLGLLAQEGFFPSYVLWSKSGAVPFYKKAQEERIELIKSWIDGREWVFFPPLRTFARSILRLTCLSFIKTQAHTGEVDLHNEEAVLFRALGITEKRKPTTDNGIRNIERENTGGMGDGLYPFEFLDLSKDRSEAEILWLVNELNAQLSNGGVPAHEDDVGPKHTLKTEKIGEEEYRVIETDALVIGSGCGGAVVAMAVAEANGKVLVVEKGTWYPNSTFPKSERETGTSLYEGGTFYVRPEQENLALLAGSTWGGGGTVNWSVCLQTQGFVREEWATSYGVPFYLSQTYQKKLDEVFNRLGATLHSKHNNRNNNLLEGAHKLGYYGRALHQNSGGTQHIDGYCTSGCGGNSGNPEDGDGWGWKLGVAQTYLPDAARAGAEFIQGLFVESIIIENGVATGAKGLWIPPHAEDGEQASPIKVIINAKTVVVSCGSLSSPALLLRSKIENPNIGLNLTVHPSAAIMAIYPEETKPLYGASTTAIVTTFENIDGEGYGAKLECTNMLPTFVLSTIPWTSPQDYKRKLLQWKNMDAYVSICRDKIGGRVYLDPANPNAFKVDYIVSEIDRKHLTEGAIAAAKIAYVQGAKEIFLNNTAIPTFFATVAVEARSILDPEFQEWIARVREQGLHAPEGCFASAHQMGTCRMGPDKSKAVVDIKGKVFGVENLYVADASVLPTASGVNPMVTTMATAAIIADGLLKEVSGDWKAREERWGRARWATVEAAKGRLAASRGW